MATMNPAIYKRVWKEIEDVNSDFFNLRTKISPDPHDDMTRFYFVMLPNDGAMAHLPLVGCFYIPEQYPDSPPAVHLYTTTGRYNVDVFRVAMKNKTRSTMCFDILRNREDQGAWKPEYSISTLFASLMSAIVSFYVTQQYGGEKPEYVSMERLQAVKNYARDSYETHKDRLPSIPDIPLVEAVAIPAKALDFPKQITTDVQEVFSSGPIYLQTGDESDVYSFAVDLSDLHVGVIFSVVLSNKTTDLVGKKPDTILVRNGVTATAARKCANEQTKWFYHGKPMNDGDMRLHVTVGRDQMTMAYYSHGRLYVHGDCPVSRLGSGQIGDVKNMPFYVNVFLKRKGRLAKPATVTFLDIDGKGYIHDGSTGIKTRDGGDEEDFGFELIDPAEAAVEAEKGVKANTAQESESQAPIKSAYNPDDFLLNEFAQMSI
ncbi:hypothetical protein F5Y15DRAFT_388453 [Xylariaceae sp. FL0016]|nr:hypothetical protein F5Y15DRAFT_388453 [Xylariaceae sp. FL0016]